MPSDIRVSTGMYRHPKIKDLRKAVGPAGPWALMCLWSYCGENKPDGDLSGKTDRFIESASEWDGVNGALIDALVDVGLMDGYPLERRIHDWDEHQPWLSGSNLRSENASYAALIKNGHSKTQADKILKRRSKKGVRIACGPHAESCDPHAPSPSPLPSPSPIPNQYSLVPVQAGDAPRGNVVGIDSALSQNKSRRLQEVTKDATESYNASPFTKSHGGSCPNIQPSNLKASDYVKRCLRQASAICNQLYGSPTIPRGFWEDYWATVNKDDFSAGRSPRKPGHESWNPDFEFLTRPDQMAKLFDRDMSEEQA